MSPFNNSKARHSNTREAQPQSKRDKCPVCGKTISAHGEGFETDACVREATGTKVTGNPSSNLQTAFDILNNDVPAAPRPWSWSAAGTDVCMTFSNGELEYGPTYPIIVCGMILRYAGIVPSKGDIPVEKEVVKEESVAEPELEESKPETEAESPDESF
jgi:hypothetical protein